MRRTDHGEKIERQRERKRRKTGEKEEGGKNKERSARMKGREKTEKKS